MKRKEDLTIDELSAELREMSQDPTGIPDFFAYWGIGPS